jgi:hypothetical protein
MPLEVPLLLVPGEPKPLEVEDEEEDEPGCWDCPAWLLLPSPDDELLYGCWLELLLPMLPLAWPPTEVEDEDEEEEPGSRQLGFELVDWRFNEPEPETSVLLDDVVLRLPEPETELPRFRSEAPPRAPVLSQRVDPETAPGVEAEPLTDVLLYVLL